MTVINLGSHTYDGTTILDRYEEIGSGVTPAGDFDGDGFDDLLVRERHDERYADRAAVAVFTGGPETLTREFVFFGTEQYNDFGWPLGSIGDFNGDGFDDIASDGGRWSYRYNDVLVDLGRPDGGEGGRFRIKGSVASLDSAGDMNADGFDDMLLGGGSGTYVLFGNPDAAGEIDLAALPAGAGFKIEGASPGDAVGISVASAGDVNGDGFDDVLVGASYNDAGGENAGAAYVLFGKAGGFANVDLGAIAPGEGFSMRGVAFEQVGRIVSSAGDINGDGYDDVAVTGVGGRIYVVFGKSGGFGNIKLETLAPDEGFEISHDGTEVARDGISSAGDIDGDGYDELLIGRPKVEGNRGAAYVIYGRPDGFEGIDLDNLEANDGFVLRGDIYNNAGQSVAGAGDLNGDGFDDIAIGAPDHSGNGGKNDPERDAVYVIYGGERFAAIDFRGGLGDDWAVGGTREDFLSGGAGADLLSAGGSNDFLRGGNGDDVLEGGEDDDRLDGGQGIDTASYASAIEGVVIDLSLETQDTVGAGTDTLISFENATGSTHADHLIGSSGNNVLDGGKGNDRLDGGEGSDTASYASATQGVVVDLSLESQDTVGAGTDALVSIENATGSAHADHLLGSSDRNLLRGGEGNDLLEGRGGGDRFEGGHGDDTVSYEWAATGVRVSLAKITLQDTNVGIDRIIGVENLVGSAAGDVLGGNAGENLLRGGAGDDRLVGNAGADVLAGGAGRDDFLFRDGDSDAALSLADRVLDFSRGDGDRIHLGLTDAIAQTEANEAFTFVGTARFSGEAGELRYVVRNGDVVVKGDVDGDRIPDFAILVENIVHLDAVDFVL